MVGESGTSHTMKVHRYYKCVSVKNHRGCDKKTVKKEWIENLVIEQIQKVIFNDELVNRLADAIIDLQSKENTSLPLLHKQFAEVQKNELSVQIIKEEMAKPTLTKEQIIFWIERFRKLNIKHLDHRRRLIDSFVNAIYLYDDKMIITFNYKDGTQTIPFEEIEKSEIGSDINSVGAPEKNPSLQTG